MQNLNEIPKNESSALPWATFAQSMFKSRLRAGSFWQYGTTHE